MGGNPSIRWKGAGKIKNVLVQRPQWILNPRSDGYASDFAVDFRHLANKIGGMGTTHE